MTDNYTPTAFLATCGLALLSPAVHADALSGNANFNIPPQSVRLALIEWSQQADVQVMGSARMLEDLQSVEVKGRLPTRVALERILQNTGLTYQEERRAVVVTAIGSAVARAPHPNAGVYPQISSDAAILPPIFVQVSDVLPLREEMIVTGTNLPGSNPVGSELIVIDRHDIAKTGYSTVQDLIKSLPQNFGGGVTEDTSTGGNVARSSALNLRGLGPGSTLVLLNGQRMAPTGASASFVDVSGIPLSAIARVEVLMDGASAIYGSDAVGGVVNFITRDYQGAETQGRFGSVTEGPAQEMNLSQLFGTDWSSGRLTFSYDYHQRDALPAADRKQTADSDLTRLGGSNFSSRLSNPATIMIGTQTFAVPRDQDGTGLSPSALIPGAINYQNTNEDRDLLPERRRHSAFVSASQSLNERVKISGDALFSRQSVSARNSAMPLTLTMPASNPFRVVPPGATGAYRVYYNFGDDLGPRTLEATTETAAGSVVARLKLPGQWEMAGALYYSGEKQDQKQYNNVDAAAVNAALADPNRSTALNVFGDGSFTNPATLDRIRRTTLFSSDSDLRGANAIANGPLFSLPGGQVRLAAGTDYRKQSLESKQLAPNASTTLLKPEYERDVSAVFAELLLPVVSGANRVSGIEKLEFSLAGRYDNYSDFGSATNPRIGVEWSPLSPVSIHGNWGKSFKAPNLVDLDERTNQTVISLLPDPQAPVGLSSVLFWLGNNRDLKAETARTWTLGVKWTPQGGSGPLIDLSYFNIRFEDRIQQAPAVGSFLTDPARYAGIVTLNPTTAQRQNVCSRGVFLGNAGLTEGDCVTAPVVAIIDSRFNNTSASTTRGLELSGSWDFESDWGHIGINSNISYLLDFSEAQTPTAPSISLIDTVGNPLRLRMRDGFSWDRSGYGIAAFLNYTDAYQDNVSVPTRKVGSWTTLDLQLSYEVDAAVSNWLSGCSFSLSVQNVFDTDPPFVNNTAGVGYDPENADLLKRFVSLRVQKSW